MEISLFWRLTVLVVCLSLPAATASAVEGAERTSRPALKVVTSISPLADIVSNIGGDNISVRHFVPLNVDPHTYEPTFSSLHSISQAQLIFLNGDGLDRAARNNLLAIRNSTCELVDLSNAIPSTEKNGIDPHYWLDLKLVQYYVKAIALSLCKADPARKQDYERNAESYLQKIRALDQRFMHASSKLPTRCKNIILYHNSWTHIATRYGYTIAGIIESTGFHEPSARQLGLLIKKSRAVGVRAVVADPGHGSRILSTVKNEAHIPLILEMVEDSLLTPPYDTYLKMMEADLQKLTGEICRT
jgi:ABC-type Zn uptake system ZnuABC Zn-binding protein ZnuA